MSRKHAIIEREGIDFFLTANKTLNPTKLDGFAAAAETKLPLKNGARVEFADLVCNFLSCPVSQTDEEEAE